MDSRPYPSKLHVRLFFLVLEIKGVFDDHRVLRNRFILGACQVCDRPDSSTTKECADDEEEELAMGKLLPNRASERGVGFLHFLFLHLRVVVIH